MDQKTTLYFYYSFLSKYFFFNKIMVQIIRYIKYYIKVQYDMTYDISLNTHYFFFGTLGQHNMFLNDNNFYHLREKNIQQFVFPAKLFFHPTNIFNISVRIFGLYKASFLLNKNNKKKSNHVIFCDKLRVRMNPYIKVHLLGASIII